MAYTPRDYEDQDKRRAMQSIDARAQQLRIEALRAAAQLCAAVIANPDIPMTFDGVEVSPTYWTKEVAEQFAAWLETGER